MQQYLLLSLSHLFSQLQHCNWRHHCFLSSQSYIYILWYGVSVVFSSVVIFWTYQTGNLPNHYSHFTDYISYISWCLFCESDNSPYGIVTISILRYLVKNILTFGFVAKRNDHDERKLGEKKKNKHNFKWKMFFFSPNIILWLTEGVLTPILGKIILWHIKSLAERFLQKIREWIKDELVYVLSDQWESFG